MKILETTAFIIYHNRRRLLILFVIVLGWMFLSGGVADFLASIANLIGSLPSLVIGLLFSAFALIAQFGVLMWFLSRPRTYTVTPDGPQIGLSFESYRWQPDIVENAKSTVRRLKRA